MSTSPLSVSNCTNERTNVQEEEEEEEEEEGQGKIPSPQNHELRWSAHAQLGYHVNPPATTVPLGSGSNLLGNWWPLNSHSGSSSIHTTAPMSSNSGTGKSITPPSPCIATTKPLHPVCEDVLFPNSHPSGSILLPSTSSSSPLNAVTSKDQPNQPEGPSLPADATTFLQSLPQLPSSQSGTANQGKSRFFILADGHGGYEAAAFFVSHMAVRVRELLESRSWHFNCPADQVEFRSSLILLHQTLDNDFCTQKIEAFRAYNNTLNRVPLLCGKMGDGHKKPLDDGCTLIINIFHSGYYINSNVGDSRTILAALSTRPLSEDDAQSSCNMYTSHDTNTSLSQVSSSTDSFYVQKMHMQLLQRFLEEISDYESPDSAYTCLIYHNHYVESQLNFISADHNMTHGSKIRHLYQKGALLVKNTGRPFLDSFEFLENDITCSLSDVSSQALPSPPHSAPPSPFRSEDELSSLSPSDSTIVLSNHHHHVYPQLARARLFFKVTTEMLSLGISTNRTLNISATMGDIAFKLGPNPLMSSEPDISFCPLNPNQHYVMVAASDGIWDHLIVKGHVAQSNLLLSAVLSGLTGQDPEIEAEFASQSVTCPTQKDQSQNSEQKNDAEHFFLADRIPLIARKLSTRPNATEIYPTEKTGKMNPFMLFGKYNRYDDASCQVVLLEPSVFQ